MRQDYILKVSLFCISLAMLSAAIHRSTGASLDCLNLGSVQATSKNCFQIERLTLTVSKNLTSQFYLTNHDLEPTFLRSSHIFFLSNF